MKILASKSTIPKIKYSLEGLNSRFDLSEVRISELEDSTIEMMQSQEQREIRMNKNEQSLGDMWEPLSASTYV